MSDIGDALGTAAEGGLFARAVSGEKGPARDATGHFAEGQCLNCGTELIGDHCHECGQKAHLHRTLGAFLHDLLHGALHFEGKTWRTLPELALRPGKLTRRYIEGERRKFVSPMALFLFSVFLMFAVFQAAGLSVPPDIENTQMAAEVRAIDAIGLARDELEELPAEDAEARAEAEARIDELEATLEKIKAGEDYEFVDAEGNRAYQQFNLTGLDFIDRTIVKKWRTNPSLMLYKLQANGYKFSWLLIPLSIPFVWLLFAWKRRFRAYDHAIFVTYSIAFMSLLFIAVSLLAVAGLKAGWLVWAVLLIPPIHIYKQLRYAYGLSRLSTIWRLVFLLLFISVVLILFLLILTVLGAF